MQIKIEKDKAEVVQSEHIVAGAIAEYNITTEFSTDWNDLTVKAIFSDGETAYETAVMNNNVIVPKLSNGKWYVGFVGYTIANEVKTKQISTNLIAYLVNEGAGELETEEQEVPEPSVWEQYVSTMNEILEDTTEIRAEINSKYDEYNSNAVAKTNEFNSNFDVKKAAIDGVCTNVQEIEDNVEQMQEEINIAIADGLQDYNDNATEKTTAFNSNYTIKKAEIDNVKDVATDLVSAVTFSTFDVDTDDGCIYIVTPEKLANAGFNVNEETGDLEVIYNG